jgi:hypothetical protein
VVAVSGGLLFAGYQLLVFGWSQVNHGNAGFFDILWPGRYKGNPLDSGAIAVNTPTGLNDTAAGGTVGGAPQGVNYKYQPQTSGTQYPPTPATSGVN